ncbi:glycosyltransferase family 2 protein [Croceicoccus sp. F390]|uniref:Glycosyltransferase family 2 protein n=1 Tax=Croceicoccus esteveae TaxID=3075597 RepID=A0ABU2ZD82_9SPHN|nr:glycosyltransferase family 2 protein [Croceicoccus sp. F390]MDT0574572.1 glycosyltransferase family 2 protein [Croceicoccus sp. F390]
MPPATNQRNAGECDVSFAVALFNAMPFLPDAINSALSQNGVTVEVLIVDDHGSDEGLAWAQALAARDSRVRIFQTPVNSGPGGARNVAIENMRGRWFAVLDSDDWIEKDRTAALIAEAELWDAHCIADDLVVFGEGRQETRYLGPDEAGTGFWLDLDTYFKAAVMYGKAPNPGFLKPMIRCDLIERLGLRYNPALRIAEDDELVVRLLLDGARYRVSPQAMYHYRKHAASISHRLSARNAERMLEVEQHIRARLIAEDRLTTAYAARWHALVAAVSFARSIEHLKHRRWAGALSEAVHHPRSIALYAMPLRARIARMFARDTKEAPPQGR